MSRVRELNLPSKYLKDEKNYIKIKELGSGEYGVVELVEDINTKKKFAKKTFRKSEDDPIGDQIYTFREFLTLLSIHYPGLPLLQLEAVELAGKNKPGFVFTDFLEGGSLEDLIKSGFMDCDDIVTTKMIILFGIAFAIKILHFKELVHRDLKPANVLLDEKYRPFLADFGFARDISKCITMTGNIGSHIYMAPELEENDELDPDTSIDIYSFAVLAVEIICQAFPRKIKNKLRLPKSLPESFNAMITECLSENPNDRWTADQIVNQMVNGNVILPGCNMDVYFNYVQGLQDTFDNILRNEEEDLSNDEEEDSHEFPFEGLNE